MHITPAPMLLRRPDAANILAVSVSQILKWERSGLLTPIAIPGIRVVAYDAEEVRDLARRFIQSARVVKSTELATA